jgi:GNAT superfamily N-acetyltransferase
MTIERVDPMTLDAETGAQLAEVVNASTIADGGDFPANTANSILGELRYGGRDKPADAFWVARDDSGHPVGVAELELTQYDNPEMAFVFCEVHRDHRGRGVGTALLEAQIAEARAHGRTALMTFHLRDSPAQEFLESRGFTSGMKTANRRLDLPDLDYGHIESLHEKATAASSDYELVRLDGPAPTDWLPELVAVHEAINDAPMDDLTMQPEAFPVERLQAWERALTKRNQHLYRLLARHRESRAWAGHTVLLVDGDRPGFAHQEDTSVVVAHRGHRLGLLLKTAMLLWMRDAEPGLEMIDTWNAESNTHMIAVNDEIGCRVANRGVGMEMALDGSDPVATR